MESTELVIRSLFDYLESRGMKCAWTTRGRRSALVSSHVDNHVKKFYVMRSLGEIQIWFDIRCDWTICVWAPQRDIKFFDIYNPDFLEELVNYCEAQGVPCE